MNVRFDCPECETPGRLELPGETEWLCPNCSHRVEVQVPVGANGLEACALCGTPELYKKKDFPHRLGLAILTLACVGSIIPYWLYMPWLVWTILLGSLAFDVILYKLVGDVVVCYRCQAHYRGLPNEASFPPHELGIAERYRQEQIRREQLQAARKK